MNSTLLASANDWLMSTALGAVIIIGTFAVVVAAAIMITVIALRKSAKERYEFITIIAHKFRTPLTSTKWTLEDELKSEPEGHRREILERVREANEKLISLTGTLIELTNTDNGAREFYKFEPVDVCAFVRNAVEVNRSRFHEKNIFFSIQCTETPVKANIDQPRIDFVLQTLLENACTYTPPGKNVGVSVEVRGKYVCITVADAGIGIDPADLKRVGSKFFRTKNASRVDTEGFGIGLYLARSVLKRHHGSLRVESPGLGKGSAFTMILKKMS